MKITQLKCTNCGAKLEVKDNDKKVRCNYCGYDYILDDNKIIVEHVVIDEKDKVLFENADTFLNKLNDYHEAYLLYSKLSKSNPGNKDCWKGIILSISENLKKSFFSLSKSEKRIVSNAYNNYLSILSGKDEFTAKYEEYAVDNSRKPKHKSIFVAIIVLVVLALAFALLLIMNIAKEDIIKRNKENEQNKFEEKYKFVKEIKCSALSEKINSFSIDYSDGGGFFVNGKGYTLYLNKKVSSTDENCEVNNYYTYDLYHNTKESTNVGKFVSVSFIHPHTIESGYIFTSNGYYCYYDGICYTVGDQTMHDYQTPLYYYNRIKNAANELGFSLEDSSNYQMFIETTTFYVYYNNKLYIEVDGLFREVEMNLDKDEYIEKITHHIRTNKAYYDIEDYVTNREECQEYMDVECKTNYKLIPSKTLNLKYDEIYYADYFVILKDGSIYIDKTKQKKLDGLLNTELGI